MILHSQPITSEGFKPYGSLLSSVGSVGVSVNENRGMRFDTAANLVHTTQTSQPKLALYKIEASKWPVDVRILERHSRTAQLFLPMMGGVFLVVVARALDSGGPAISSLAAFTCAPDQGIVYAPGIWHLPLVAIDEPADFAMLMWENGTSEDCEEHLMAIAVTVHSPQGAQR